MATEENELVTQQQTAADAFGNPMPPPNIATLSMLDHNEEHLRVLRADQHHCDDMVTYWTTRHADVTRSIEAIQASTQALNRVAPRPTTRVVTKSKPKAKSDA